MAQARQMNSRTRRTRRTRRRRPVPELRLAEWETRGPGREPLAGRTIEDAPARRLVEELNRSGVLQVQELRRGLQVRTTSYVGRIQVDDLVITVEPKLEPKTLLGLVRYAYGLRHLRRYGTAEYRSAGSLFQDLLAAQLLSEARRALGQRLGATLPQARTRAFRAAGTYRLRQACRAAGLDTRDRTLPGVPTHDRPRAQQNTASWRGACRPCRAGQRPIA